MYKKHTNQCDRRKTKARGMMEDIEAAEHKIKKRRRTE